MNQAAQLQDADQNTTIRIDLGTLRASTATLLIQNASSVATELSKMIVAQNLATNIQGKNYVKVEGWTTLAVMLGCIAREVSTTENNGTYTSVVELVRFNDGVCISRASAECGEEKPWNGRPRFARRSMAQTRATSKACRLAFSWVMTLAGYETTPAEEMIEESREIAVKPLEVVRDRISLEQVKLLERKIKEAGIDMIFIKERIDSKWGVRSLSDLNNNQLSILLERIRQKQAIV